MMHSGLPCVRHISAILPTMEGARGVTAILHLLLAPSLNHLAPPKAASVNKARANLMPTVKGWPSFSFGELRTSIRNEASLVVNVLGISSSHYRACRRLDGKPAGWRNARLAKHLNNGQRRGYPRAVCPTGADSWG